MTNAINITVAIDNGQVFCHEHAFTVEAGLTFTEALAAFYAAHPYIEPASANDKIGVFGLAVNDDYTVQDGDRLEVYQKLKIDPKQARRIRAERAKHKS